MDKDKVQINECPGCNKAIVQTEGKRRRIWCSDACRVATARRSNPNINNEQAITEQAITNKPERTAQGNIRVSKPGDDDDYVPMCETTRATVPVSDQPKRVYPLSIHKPEGRPKFIPGHLADLTNDIAAANPKRGKDIKTFADLPPDVQSTINRLSESNEEKQKRTKAAIKYQHLFPDRFHSTGIAQTAEKS